VSEDQHSPTTAGPEPADAAAQAPDAAATAPQPPAPDPTPQPTPTVGAEQAAYGRPAGSVLLDTGQQEDPHPEKLVGAAFAGGLVAAIVLKGMARRKHR
jgi:hypothetical protein